MNKKLLAFSIAGLLSAASANAEWTGLAGPYAGVQLVGAQASMTIEDSDCWYNCSAYTQRKTGGLYGLQGGFNWVSGNLLLGAELEYAVGSLEKSFDYGFYNGANDDMRLTSELKNLAALRLKMGLVSNDTALVVSVGPAQGKFASEFRDRDGTLADAADDDVASFSDEISGLVFGVSAEHAFTSNITIGLKYSRYSFNDKSDTVFTNGVTNSGSIVKLVNEVDSFALSANWSF
ncbi:MAG TPA: outer membrane beta-barrel protein [Steroidobacteraceae bacterium]|nr:outer membrane beta-barrel protein [Steroidobacteraceae bacterium]